MVFTPTVIDTALGQQHTLYEPLRLLTLYCVNVSPAGTFYEYMHIWYVVTATVAYSVKYK